MKQVNLKKYIFLPVIFFAIIILFTINQKVHADEYLVILSSLSQKTTIESGTHKDTLKLKNDESIIDNIPYTDEIIITGKTESGFIIVERNVPYANITFLNLSIDTSYIRNQAAFLINSNSNVQINLKGKNFLKSGNNFAGLQVNECSTLCIYSESNENTLTAIGGINSAGIGSGCTMFGSAKSNSHAGTIIILGGTINAFGGACGAGIGGGYKSGSSIIDIQGGIIKAIGGNSAAGIGGGKEGSGSITKITNADVTVTVKCDEKNESGAGIGGGAKAESGMIIITHSTIKASGGICSSISCGAGIGGGAHAKSNIISITQSVIYSNSSSGAGIGGGFGATYQRIEINHSSVTSKSNTGSGIGGGYNSRIDKNSSICILESTLCVSSISIGNRIKLT